MQCSHPLLPTSAHLSSLAELLSHNNIISFSLAKLHHLDTMANIEDTNNNSNTNNNLTNPVHWDIINNQEGDSRGNLYHHARCLLANTRGLH